jgi:alpha-beta hydrolase superfamily lysophospholipase
MAAIRPSASQQTTDTYRRNKAMNLNDTTSTAPIGSTSYLVRPEGRIGYDVAGTGPLLVLVPGMGDLRAGYRFLAPALRAAGYRVACAYLRGHGARGRALSAVATARHHRRRGPALPGHGA